MLISRSLLSQTFTLRHFRFAAASARGFRTEPIAAISTHDAWATIVFVGQPAMFVPVNPYEFETNSDTTYSA